MKLIVITRPEFFESEAGKIVELFSGKGIDLLHLRKPGSSEEQLRNLLSQIPERYHSRLVLHDHFSLAPEYGLFGVHLNSRNPEPPEGWKGSVSRSCHSFDEIIAHRDSCSYLSISPVFDSISKAGYRSAFSRDEIADAVDKGIIDSKVYALGGVTFDKLPLVDSMGFGGEMILSEAWR